MDSSTAKDIEPDKNSRDDSLTAKCGKDSAEITTENILEDLTLKGNNSEEKEREAPEQQSLVSNEISNSFEKEKNANEFLEGTTGNASEDTENSVADEDIELPSTAIDRKQIFMPLDLKIDDPRIFGKWLWFSNGDLSRQDYVWIELQFLILNGLVILLESSTARMCEHRGQGVIKCYTRGDTETIKRAGLAIQNITKDNAILFYKTNQASRDCLNRRHGDRFITKHMLTASGKFYGKDKLDRWKPVEDTKDEMFNSVKNYHYPSYRIDAESLPSQEYEARRYFYPRHSNLVQFDHSWTLFCSVAEFDSHGMTELDRAWMEAKMLRDEGIFTSVSCETLIVDFHQLRRTVSFTVTDYHNLDRLIQSGDKIRERISYNFPMYMKVSRFNDENKHIQTLKYMYTDDRDLYEHVDNDWKLIQRVW